MYTNTCTQQAACNTDKRAVSGLSLAGDQMGWLSMCISEGGVDVVGCAVSVCLWDESWCGGISLPAAPRGRCCVLACGLTDSDLLRSFGLLFTCSQPQHFPFLLLCPDSPDSLEEMLANILAILHI